MFIKSTQIVLMHFTTNIEMGSLLGKINFSRGPDPINFQPGSETLEITLCYQIIISRLPVSNSLFIFTLFIWKYVEFAVRCILVHIVAGKPLVFRR